MRLWAKQILRAAAIVTGFTLFSISYAALAAAPEGLFADESILELEIQSNFPYRSYKGRDAKEEVSPELFPEYDGKVFVKGYDGFTPVKIKARGMSKLNLCDFAPVSLRFNKGNDNQIFSGQKKVKLATHCDEGTSIAQGTHPAEDGVNSDQYIMREYLAYKAHEILMPEASLKTRLAKIKYTDSQGSVIAIKMAFFLEHKDQFFKRNPLYSNKTVEEIQKAIFGASPPSYDSKDYTLKQTDALELHNYFRFLLLDRLIVPSDRSLGMFSGNTLTFLNSHQKVMHLHFDFDRSLWVGKFEVHQEQRPNELASDIRVLCQGSRGSEPDFTAEEILRINLTAEVRAKVCSNVITKMSQENLDKKLMNFLKSFSYLPAAQKQQILDRTELFFQELNRYR